ncbi:MAG: phosphoribosyltransferase family protein, partial [Gammaproteobacteria bacterium]
APRTTDDPAAVTPVLVDDIISTAQTMAEGVRMLRKAGYPAPICVGVHALFAERAWETLERAGAAAVITTNSVAHPSNGIDLGGLLATELHAFLEELDDPPPAGD